VTPGSREPLFQNIRIPLSTQLFMSNIALIDYGCHSFSFRLVERLQRDGYPFRYLVNGSLESPNLSSLSRWERDHPDLLRVVRCGKPYGKMNLLDRLRGEIEWSSRCIAALEAEIPTAIICSCLPLPVMGRIQAWARRRRIPCVYWLQDLQGTAIAELLGKRLGIAGRAVGSIAKSLEHRMLERSDHIITIATQHEQLLPRQVRNNKRFTLLENWANIEEIPVLSRNNAWAAQHGLDRTTNIVYSGTLGFNHDLRVFPVLASALRSNPDARVVVVSSGAAADHIREVAQVDRLDNLLVFPFQPYEDVPKVLASASVLIAPLDPSAGSFCVPSKVLSYLCAGRPTVLAIDDTNPAARMINGASAGMTVTPGDTATFVSVVLRLINDIELRSTLGGNARKFAEATFSLDAVAPRFLHILESAGVKPECRPTPHSVRNALARSVIAG
jgi:colanic acid biosynthesis glycosyl transferase WcaI